MDVEVYYDCVPKENQWKLDKELDFEHHGVQTHLGEISNCMDEWEGRVAVALKLTPAIINGIKEKHPDNLNLQTREALHHWQEKNGLKATYRNLIAAFHKAEKASLVEAVCKVLGYDNGFTYTETTSRNVDRSSVDVMDSCSPEVAPSEGDNRKEKVMLQVNEANIRKSFGDLMLQVQRVLKRKDIDMEDFLTFVGYQFPAEILATIPLSEKGKISTIFQAITSHGLWSYEHYFPLKSIAKEFAEDDTKPLIESYERELANFNTTTKLIDYIALFEFQDEERVVDPDVPNPVKYDSAYYQKLTLKLDIPVTDKTLQYIADIWKDVAKFFLLPSLTALLDRIVDGSLVISWMIPQHFALQIWICLTDSTGDEATAFFQSHHIIKVNIDNEILYSSETTVESDDFKLDLLAACKEGNMDQVLELLKKISDFDFSQYDDTPLTAAARHAPLDIVQVLLLYQFDVNERNKNGWTALTLACGKERTDVVKLLIKHNADVNARSKDGWTALMSASFNERTDVVELLIKYNADMNVKSKAGLTALMVASQEGRTDVVELLIKHNADLNARSKDGWTALMLASLEGRTDIVELLIKHNADVNTSMEDGWTALMHASYNGRTDIVELLIKHDGDVNSKSKDGWTALMLASFNGRTDVVELLIKYNADVNAPTEDGVTALIMASQEGRINIVKLLIKHNAVVNARSKDGWTALMLASFSGRTNVMELLIKYNADVNARKEDGVTALIVASQEGRIDAVKLLIKHNAVVNARSKDGWTALMFARQVGRTDVVELLIKHNADVNNPPTVQETQKDVLKHDRYLPSTLLAQQKLSDSLVFRGSPTASFRKVLDKTKAENKPEATNKRTMS